jgi:magnesium transporter
MWRALATHGNGSAQPLSTIEELAAALATEKTTVWIDFHQPSPDEVRLLADTFALDPLSVEDCVADQHHPKIDEFDHYLYLVVHGVQAGTLRGELETVELDVVLTKNALATYRHDEMRSVAEVWRRAMSRDGFLGRGPAQTLQAILAAQADHYIDEVESLEDETEQLEVELFADRPSKGFERRVFDQKRDIAHLRQILGSQRELLHRLGRGDCHMIPARLRMPFRDVYDHLYRATEMLDTLRELTMALIETHLSLVANRTNQVMRVLTTVATFILPLSLITSWYGMNFRGLAGLGIAHPDLYVLASFAIVAVLMAFFLRRRGWL